MNAKSSIKSSATVLLRVPTSKAHQKLKRNVAKGDLADATHAQLKAEG